MAQEVALTLAKGGTYIRAIHLILIYCPWGNRISIKAYDQTLGPRLYCAK